MRFKFNVWVLGAYFFSFFSIINYTAVLFFFSPAHRDVKKHTGKQAISYNARISKQTHHKQQNQTSVLNHLVVGAKVFLALHLFLPVEVLTLSLQRSQERYMF